MEWVYANLVGGRLTDDEGSELNENWPSFKSVEDAEKYLEDNDIRASVRTI